MSSTFFDMYKSVSKRVRKWCLKHDLITSMLLTVMIGLSIGGVMTALNAALVG